MPAIKVLTDAVKNKATDQMQYARATVSTKLNDAIKKYDINGRLINTLPAEQDLNVQKSELLKKVEFAPTYAKSGVILIIAGLALSAGLSLLAVAATVTNSLLTVVLYAAALVYSAAMAHFGVQYGKIFLNDMQTKFLLKLKNDSRRDLSYYASLENKVEPKLESEVNSMANSQDEIKVESEPEDKKDNMVFNSASEEWELMLSSTPVHEDVNAHVTEQNEKSTSPGLTLN